MSIRSDVISPSSKLSPKTNAERQRKYRLKKNDVTDNGDKPVKMSKAEYNHQYRLKRKVGAKLKSDSAKIILKQKHEAVTVYNSVKKKVRDVRDFLHEALLAYTKGGSKLLKKRYHELPLILGSDFNIQFDSGEELRCISRKSAGNIKRSPAEIVADPENEDEFGYTMRNISNRIDTDPYDS
ncbi:hypothetical protein PV328_001196 [Microctonus aethiopoides]|uniref:Uncharacterized protein n=1 Tax=Microctonus aethiopoides TaxID=144406 RepID=A0AA39KXB4_9HYME|nr:hypothetical protein PV328_001196 [Microctonus aethiopoides]